MRVGIQDEMPFVARFTDTGAPVHLTGVQALARLPLDQVRRDVRAGLRVKGFVSGYPGSPLAGCSWILRVWVTALELARNGPLSPRSRGWGVFRPTSALRRTRRTTCTRSPFAP